MERPTPPPAQLVTQGANLFDDDKPLVRDKPRSILEQTQQRGFKEGYTKGWSDCHSARDSLDREGALFRMEECDEAFERGRKSGYNEGTEYRIAKYLFMLATGVAAGVLITRIFF